MKIKYALMGALVLVFVTKYIQILPITGIMNSATLYNIANALMAISFISLIVLSFLLLEEKWKWENIGVGVVGFLIFIGDVFYHNPATYTFYNIFLATSLFLLLYPFHHYEIKKFPAFGYAFFTIYVLMEGTAIWWKNANAVVFFSYLTLALIMFIPGILKIKEGRAEEVEEAAKTADTVEVA